MDSEADMANIKPRQFSLCQSLIHQPWHLFHWWTVTSSLMRMSFLLFHALLQNASNLRRLFSALTYIFCMTWEICLLLFFLLRNKWKRNVFVLDEKNCFSNRKLLRPSAEMSGLTRVFLQYPSQVFKTSQSVVSQAQSPTAGTQTVRRNSDLKAVKVNVASCCEIPDGSLTEPCLPLHVSVYNCTSNSLQPAQRCRSTWWKGSLQQKRTKPQQDKVTLAHTGKHIHLNLFKSHW